VFSIIAVVAMLLLAAGLSDLGPLARASLSLESLWQWLWQQMWQAMWQVGTPEIAFLPGGYAVLFVLRAFFLLCLLLFPFVIIYFIINPELQKRVLRDVSRLLLFSLAFYLIVRHLTEVTDEGGPMLSPLLPGAGPFPAQPIFEPGTSTPPWLVFATTLCLAVPIAVMVMGVIWLIWRRRRRPESSLVQIARGAQGALDSLGAGGDLRNTVIRCYLEMSRALREERGIQRGRAMTPREFEKHLIAAGLPAEPVEQLTRLFEEVRYGSKTPGEQEERRAVECLTAIVEACRSSAPA
jgi:hypothetical protein